jgi:outer membrane translocation and assembly module TamA
MTAHTFARSISPERGMAVGATVELAREALGASDAATTSTGDFRAYLPAFGRHDVLALRVGGGTTSGPPGVRRTFVMGGLDNVGDVINFSRDAFGLLRGFPVNTFAGSHVALVNADYRLPLARPERGVGTWPILLRSLHATAFADAGHAWSDSFHTRDIKTSLGGELVLDLVAGYSLPVSVAIGAAVGHDRATGREHSLVYGRFSRTF